MQSLRFERLQPQAGDDHQGKRLCAPDGFALGCERALPRMALRKARKKVVALCSAPNPHSPIARQVLLRERGKLQAGMRTTRGDGCGGEDDGKAAVPTTACHPFDA